MTPFTFEKTPSTPQKQPPASTAVARLALTAGSVTAAGSLTTVSACAGAHWATTALTANAATARRARERRRGVTRGSAAAARWRSEERCGGKEWGSTCRSGRSPYNSQKKKTEKK